MPDRIVLVAFDGAQSLDITGPTEVFAHAAREPGGRPYRIIVASRKTAITTSSGLRLATTPLEKVRCGRGDTILVAGGDEPGITTSIRDRQLLRWLGRRSAKVQRIGSVCSGTFILAAAGLLDGRT